MPTVDLNSFLRGGKNYLTQSRKDTETQEAMAVELNIGTSAGQPPLPAGLLSGRHSPARVFCFTTTVRTERRALPCPPRISAAVVHRVIRSYYLHLSEESANKTFRLCRHLISYFLKLWGWQLLVDGLRLSDVSPRLRSIRHPS